MRPREGHLVGARLDIIRRWDAVVERGIGGYRVSNTARQPSFLTWSTHGPRRWCYKSCSSRDFLFFHAVPFLARLCVVTSTALLASPGEGPEGLVAPRVDDWAARPSNRARPRRRSCCFVRRPEGL